jgi:hypothetical protein
MPREQPEKQKNMSLRCETDFQLELARGTSHIASSMTPDSVRQSIREALDGFVKLHGLTRLHEFREVLFDRLHVRGKGDAAKLVLEWQQNAFDEVEDRVAVTTGRAARRVARAHRIVAESR